MNENEVWAWIAAFWEGEGSITIGERGKHGGHVKVSNTNKTAVEFIEKKLGRDKCQIYFDKRRKKEHSDCYRLFVTGYMDILYFLNKIKPYLIFRQKEVEETIERVTEMMKETYHFWTREEVNFIKQNWKNMSDIEISEKVGHTFRATKQKRQQLGLLRTKI